MEKDTTHSTPIIKKLGVSIGALLIFLGVSVFWIWYSFIGPGYYAEFNDIKTSFSDMEGVALIDAWGHEDITFEDIGALVEVEDKGPITFVQLSPDSFSSTSKICLQSIGPYQFEYNGTGYAGVKNNETGEPMISQFHGSSIEIGEDGWFAGFFPSKIEKVQDVFKKYDEICEVISNWPVSPQKEYLRLGDGTEIWFSVKKIK